VRLGLYLFTDDLLVILWEEKREPLEAMILIMNLYMIAKQDLSMIVIYGFSYRHQFT
jgi:hypothetical protein